jgi:hypothetical protein
MEENLNLMEERGGLSPAASPHDAPDQNRVTQAQETGGNASADTSLDTTPKRPWTPGPWSVIQRFDVISDRLRMVVQGSRDIESDDASEANARLIACAPELFEALERLLLFSESHELSGQYGQGVLDELFEIETQARSAIEKAEGVQP